MGSMPGSAHHTQESGSRAAKYARRFPMRARLVFDRKNHAAYIRQPVRSVIDKGPTHPIRCVEHHLLLL
jgi:hypothetical protein